MSHFTLDCYCLDWYMQVTTNVLLERMDYYNYWIVTCSNYCSHWIVALLYSYITIWWLSDIYALTLNTC